MNSPRIGVVNFKSFSSQFFCSFVQGCFFQSKSIHPCDIPKYVGRVVFTFPMLINSCNGVPNISANIQKRYQISDTLDYKEQIGGFQEIVTPLTVINQK